MSLAASDPGIFRHRRTDGDAGILLIGHGTRDPRGTAQFFALEKMLARRVAPMPVEACLLELQQPDIPTGWQRLVKRGVRHVHAAPLLLFAAGHARRDIPAVLAACRERTPQVTWDQAPPLSRCPELLSLVARRLDEAIAGIDFNPDRTAIVMVGRGSRDACAQADLKVLCRCVAMLRPVRKVLPSFYAMAEPALPAVLDQAAADPQVRDVIVQPHLLFDGAIFHAVGEAVQQAEAKYPQCRFRYSGFLGPEPELVDAVLRRVFDRINRPA